MPKIIGSKITNIVHEKIKNKDNIISSLFFNILLIIPSSKLSIINTIEQYKIMAILAI